MTIFKGVEGFNFVSNLVLFIVKATNLFIFKFNI